MKTKETLDIVLDGNIFLVTRRGEKEVKREELDGEACLKAILYVLKESFRLFDTDKEFRKELKRIANERRSKSSKSI